MFANFYGFFFFFLFEAIVIVSNWCSTMLLFNYSKFVDAFLSTSNGFVLFTQFRNWIARVVTSSRLSILQHGHMLNISHWLTERYIFFFLVHVFKYFVWFQTFFSLLWIFYANICGFRKHVRVGILEIFLIIENIFFWSFLKSNWFTCIDYYKMNYFFKSVPICNGHTTHDSNQILLYAGSCLVPFPNIIYHVYIGVKSKNLTKCY